MTNDKLIEETRPPVVNVGVVEQMKRKEPTASNMTQRMGDLLARGYKPEEILQSYDKLGLLDNGTRGAIEQSISEYNKAPTKATKEAEVDTVELPQSEVSSTLERIKDGDTLVVGNKDVRVPFIDTEESVHPNEERNTLKGKQTSEAVKGIFPKGAKVETSGESKDKFGRSLSQVSVNINGTPIDWGLVTMDNDMSAYETKYGTAPEDWHNVYKQYYSKYSPYQYGEVPNLMSDAEYNDMLNKHSKFDNAYLDYTKTNDRTALDNAIVDLYGNPEKVVQFRQTQDFINKKKGAVSGSLKAAYQLAEQDPDFREKYNTAVKQGSLPRTSSVAPRIPNSFWERFGATYEQTTMISNLADTFELQQARRIKDVSIPLETVLEDVPDEYKDTVTQEYNNNGAVGAWTFKNTLVEDIANNRVFDSMPFHKQLGYGALAMVLDPTTWLTGGAVGIGAKATIKLGTSKFATKSLGEKAVNISTWGALSGVEGAIYDAPRYLEGDLTYTGTDYLSTIAMSTAFGSALPTVFYGAKSVFGDGKQLKTSQEKYVDALNDKAKQTSKSVIKTRTSVDEKLDELNKREQTLASNVTESRKLTNEEYAELKQISQDREELLQAKSDSIDTVDIKATDGRKIDVRGLSDIVEVDRDQFNTVLNNVRGSMMDKKRPLWNFMIRQAKLNKTAIDNPELAKETNRMNAKLVKLVSLYPDGNLPPKLTKVLNELRMGQQQWVTNNAMEDIINDTTNQVSLLNRYVNKLKDLDLFDGDIEEVSWLELKEYAPSVLKVGKSVDGIHLEVDGAVSKEIKFIEDLAILNNQAIKKNDSILTQLVEQLNGMAVNRLVQKELGNLDNHTLKTTDTSKYLPKEVELTAIDVRNKLKAEGVEQYTPEYKEALRVSKENYKKNAEGAKTQKQRDIVRRSEVSKLEAKVNSGKLSKFSQEYINWLENLESTYKLPKEVREVGKLQEKVTKGKLIEDSANGGDTSRPMEDLMSEDKVDLGEGAEYTLKEKFDKDLIEDPAGDVQDLLPRKFNESVKISAYDTPTKESIGHLNKQLDTRVIKHLDARLRSIDKSTKENARLMSKVVKGLEINPKAVIKSAVQTGKLDNVLLVIRASEELKALQAVKKSIDDANVVRGKQKVLDELNKLEADSTSRFESKPLTEEDIADLMDDSKTLTTDDKQAISDNVKESVEEATRKETKRIEKHLNEFDATERPQREAMLKTTGGLDWIGRKLSTLTKDIATKLQMSNSKSMSYIGFNVTETGKGFGGTGQRNATGGIIKHKVLNELLMGFMPDYVKIMHKYSVQKGDNSFQTMNAQQMLGANNKTVKAFNRDFMWVQAMRSAGKKIPDNLMKDLEHVISFIKVWDDNMAVAHKYLVDNKIEGFTSDKKLSHYVPRVHQHGKYKKAINDYGRPKVKQLIETGILNGNNKLTPEEAANKADDFIEWVLKQDGTTPVEDMYMPTVDSRALDRLNMDMTIEIDGLSMLDLVNNEVMELGMKYSNRVAGWSGLSESTNGLLNSNLAIDTYKKVVEAEGGLDKADILYDDVINLMFGRPTRNGLAEEIRMLKDLTALTRMGGLGSAQLIESGQVITKGVMNLFEDPKIAKKLFEVAKENPDDIGLLKEIQTISRLSDDMEYMQRQSVNLEQSENIGANQFRKMSTKLADTMTFGKYKAPASRLLGKVTGFNAIRRYQSRVAQTGFTLNAIKHFTTGKSALSPKRLADLGLTDSKGINKDLERVIKQFVEVDEDGLPTKLNFDKWPVDVQKQFTYSLLRDEAQNIQKSLVGELPAWYNKPLMSVIFQFRQFPIVAQNKQLGRALALADKEAVVSTLLNAAMAGTVRLSKAAIVAGGISAVSNREFRYNSDTEHLALDTSKYIAQFGILPDATDFVTKAYTSYDDDGFSSDLGDTLVSFTPIWGLMKDFKDVGNPDSSKRERIEAAFGITPLGNVLFADMLKAQAQQTLAE